MSSRNESIEAVRKRIGWIYRDLKWLTDEDAAEKECEKERLLESLSSRAHYRCNGNKIYLGKLSPGCIKCVQGKWSCMFINSLCPAKCFFCAQDRESRTEHAPIACGLIFDDRDDYLDYLETFGFKGVSFSGGEPLLVFDLLLSYISGIKQRFGSNFYVWMYTNGILVDGDKLKRLRKSGLDEIRFNICPVNYDLEKVELAKRFIETVTVEIPTVPEDYDILKKSIVEMQRIGVSYLNLHQLDTTVYNYKNYINRYYTFLHQMYVPILESELTALKIMSYAADNNISIPINYCSAAYAFRVQGKGERLLLASFVREGDYEEITCDGYIRRITVVDSARNIYKVIKVLRENNCEKRLWSLDGTRTELTVHHSLLRFIDFHEHHMVVMYFTAELGDKADQDCKEIELNSRKKVFVSRKLLGLFNQPGNYVISRLFKLHLQCVPGTEGGAEIRKRDSDLLQKMRRYEQMETGFSEYF